MAFCSIPVMTLTNSLLFATVLAPMAVVGFICQGLIVPTVCPGLHALQFLTSSPAWREGGGRAVLSPVGRAARLHSSASNDNGSGRKRQNLSASAEGRRAEERRRLERKNDVVIGKTSALPGSTDYGIDPELTERQWRASATDVEREVNRLTEEGLNKLKMLQVEEAAEAFGQVYALKPTAYLWQYGIAKYYLGDYHGAAETFALNAARYESRFGEPASEERIWRDACELKILTSMNGGRKSDSVPVTSQIQESEGTFESGSKETRKVIRIARDLFSASVSDDHATVALSRAKLRSICGEYNAPPSRLDRKMWKLSSWFFLGLHYDALGETDDSKECMKMALRQCASSGNGNDIILTLPVIHMTRRDWYDDDEFIEDVGWNALGQSGGVTGLREEEVISDNVGYKWSSFNAGGNGGTKTDPVVLKSIGDSVDKMRLVDLQDALRKRGIKYNGSKSELQLRLLKSLLADAGIN